MSRRETVDYNFNHVEAAEVIQRAWRSHVDRQIFQFYKNLIGFHTQTLAKTVQQAEPSKSALVTANSGQCAATVMRLICPKEAQFMDNAAGTHVRFRLASPSYSKKFGTYPPAVFYKVYTHRPIVDLCATAPRDYTQAANKQILPMQRFNTEAEAPKINNIQLNVGQLPANETRGWYQRFENNSWRPISEKLLVASLYAAPMAAGTFKPTAKQRRIKRTNEKKRKRISWLRKIYFSSDDALRCTDETLIEDAIDNVALIAEQPHHENSPLVSSVYDLNNEIENEDVQALIEWTDCLADYDDYHSYWTHLGTAGFPSIEILGERSQSQQDRRDDKLRNLTTQITNSSEITKQEASVNQEDLDYWTLDALET